MALPQFGHVYSIMVDLAPCLSRRPEGFRRPVRLHGSHALCGARHPSAADRSPPRCHALAAMPTLPPGDKLAAPSPARVDYPEVPAAAMAALQAALVLLGRPALAFGRQGGNVLTCREIGARGRPGGGYRQAFVASGRSGFALRASPDRRDCFSAAEGHLEGISLSAHSLCSWSDPCCARSRCEKRPPPFGVGLFLQRAMRFELTTFTLAKGKARVVNECNENGLGFPVIADTPSMYQTPGTEDQDRELGLLVAAWPTLDCAIKAGILAMVRTAVGPDWTTSE